MIPWRDARAPVLNLFVSSLFQPTALPSRSLQSPLPSPSIYSYGVILLLCFILQFPLFSYLLLSGPGAPYLPCVCFPSLSRIARPLAPCCASPPAICLPPPSASLPLPLPLSPAHLPPPSPFCSPLGHHQLPPSAIAMAFTCPMSLAWPIALCFAFPPPSPTLHYSPSPLRTICLPSGYLFFPSSGHLRPPSSHLSPPHHPPPPTFPARATSTSSICIYNAFYLSTFTSMSTSFLLGPPQTHSFPATPTPLHFPSLFPVPPGMSISFLILRTLNPSRSHKTLSQSFYFLFHWHVHQLLAAPPSPTLSLPPLHPLLSPPPFPCLTLLACPPASKP